MAGRRKGRKGIYRGEKDPRCLSASGRHRNDATAQQCQRNSEAPVQIFVILLAIRMAISSVDTKPLTSMQHPGGDAAPAYGSPSPSYGSPAPEVSPSARSAKTPDSRPNTNNKNIAELVSNAPAASTQSTIGAAVSSVANAVPVSADDVRAQLAQAKATIARMTQQSEEQGLRQRKTDAVNQDSKERITTGTTGMGVQQQLADGVPVQIVAALCLLSFLLAYFFF